MPIRNTFARMRIFQFFPKIIFVLQLAEKAFYKILSKVDYKTLIFSDQS